ncbi:MAG TPA: preprotein translocase subunit YajC [Bryobacteraceae bacterium]|nr:preprotein translocase subunit YajC [Bryobacteraceae bacterium]
MVPTLFLLQAATGNPLIQLLPLLLLFGVFYLLIFLPMQRQRKNTQKMLAALENGQIVTTSGGIVGTIYAIQEDDTVVLRVKPDNIKIQVTRSSISGVVTTAEVKK